MINKKIIAFDLDDTLCTRPVDIEHLGVDKYIQCEPIPEMIKMSNALYDNGHTIYIYTARGMSIFNGNVSLIYNMLYELTLHSLQKWGVKHHGLFMGKLNYDIFIDDKAIPLKNIKTTINKLIV